MTIPVIKIQGIGPKTAEFLKNHGIITTEDLLKDGTNCLEQAPGFNKDKAEQVLKVIATSLIIDAQSSSEKTESKKGKKKTGKDKKSGDKKNSRKKDKDKKKNKIKIDEKVDAYHENDPRLRGVKEEKLPKKLYEKEMFRLQVELVKLQEWVREKGLKVVVIFEGRDAAGKGGVIKRILEHMNPRFCNIVALPAPTEREKTQWYFQRYITHLPAAGEVMLFDRSWYNRAGVEKVMGFCTPKEYQEFLRFCPEFESALVRSGIILIKYWFSVSNMEQERRFQARALERHKFWKLSPMDMESRSRWQDYSKSKDEMFFNTDIPQAPWYVVPSDDKKRARLNCISHLLDMIPYKDLKPDVPKIPPLKEGKGYKRTAMHQQTFVPKKY